MPASTSGAPGDSRAQASLPAYTYRAVLAFVSFFGTVIWLIQSGHGSGVRVGQELGEVHVELTDGSSWKLEEHRDEVVLLNFWATWCGPCRMEAPLLSRLHRDGVTVIAVATDSMPLPDLARKAHSLGIDYPVGQEPALVQRLDIRAIPTNVIIGADGKVAFEESGVPPEPILRKALDAADSR